MKRNPSYIKKCDSLNIKTFKTLRQKACDCTTATSSDCYEQSITFLGTFYHYLKDHLEFFSS